jgi:hypothetical protein
MRQLYRRMVIKAGQAQATQNESAPALPMTG